LQQYVKKGRPLFVEGRLKFDQWDDKNGGGKRSKISVVVENFQFLGSTGSPQADGASGLYDNARPRESRGDARQPSPDSAPTERPSRRRTKIDAIVDKEKRFTDADIPF